MTKVAKVLVSALALAGSSAAFPTNPGSTPTQAPDGFPTPDAQQLRNISAGGALSNAPPPAKLADSTIQSFQAIAFNEEFEVAYFSSLLANVSNGVSGYEAWNGHRKQELEKMLNVVVAQEELHALNAIDVLKHFNKLTPEPCEYHFPTTNIHDALALAEAFTALVVGTLQDVSEGAASAGDAGVVRAVASVISQEGEQNGFYRLLLKHLPSEKPFLTTSVGPFLFSFVNNNFVVPNSCPFDVKALGIPIFTQLIVEDPSKGMDVKPEDQTLTFTADLGNDAEKHRGGKGEGLFITYFSGQLLPISVPVQNAKWGNNSKMTFEALFPFEENIMQGLSIAALTTSNNFTDPDAVPAATLAAPALIQVNEKI
ncbi:sexual development protein [Ophiocordyceps sinensis CO18]|uniref:Sexual development protein n=1 Tax=Ophiocordyceps sinensis (strain Co18 / CGMCC 3.14243) TaxID=911162 RepID=T5AMF3_OPHSC|nr:sexual development protein [Ophiocordyceps sinensis CO18]